MGTTLLIAIGCSKKRLRPGSIKGRSKHRPEFAILREFFEIESGKKKHPPIHKQALRYCKKTNAVLIIPNIDQLAGNALPVASILESKVKFIAADKPFAKPRDHLEDAIKAEREGEVISRRTKSCPQRREEKRRGTWQKGKTLAQKNKAASLQFSEKILPILQGLKGEGFKTIQSLTNELIKEKYQRIGQVQNGIKPQFHMVRIKKGASFLRSPTLFFAMTFYYKDRLIFTNHFA
jgi:hypothetical protein